MALLWMDSFDHYVTADLGKKYSGGSGGTIVAAAGRHSSSSFRTPSTGNYLTKVLAPSGNVVVFGIAYKAPAFTGAGNGGIFQIGHGSTCQLMFTTTASGYWEVHRDQLPFDTLLGTSSSSPLVANTYAYIEVKATIHSSNGSVFMRVNGVPVLSLTGVNTSDNGSAAWDSVAMVGAGSGAIDRDDFYVLDGSGSAPLNDFLGDVRVDVLYPTAEGINSAWTPSSGTDNALMVDDTAPDDDTTYNSTLTTGAVDTHVMQNAPLAGALLYGVQGVMLCKKLDAGLCQLAPVVRSGSTEVVGTTIHPGTGYQYNVVSYPVNPVTGVAWTEAEFNAAEFGYKRLA